MLTLRTVRRLCAAFDTVALATIAAAISRSASRTKSDVAVVSSVCPPPPGSSNSVGGAVVDLHPSKLCPTGRRLRGGDRGEGFSSEPALIRIKKERDPEKLFHLFRSNAHNRLVVESRFAFEDTVSRLAGAKRFDLIEELLEHQKALPQGRREGFMVRIITLYGKAGMPDHALQTFAQMHIYGCRRTTKSLNATLRVLAQSKRLYDFHKVLNEAPSEFGVCLNEVSYNLTVKMLCDIGSLEGAYFAMTEMEKTGLRPDVVTYTTLMAAAYKDGQRAVGDGMWNLMVLRRCSPNLAAFNVRVQFLIHRFRPWQANHLVQKMISVGIEPDELTYNLLIKGFFMVRDAEMAKRIFRSLHCWRCKANAKIYQTMIHYLCKERDFDSAFTFCKESMKKNWFPSINSITRLLEGLMSVSKDRNAREIMKLTEGRVPSYSDEEIQNLRRLFVSLDERMGCIKEISDITDTPADNG